MPDAIESTQALGKAAQNASEKGSEKLRRSFSDAEQTADAGLDKIDDLATRAGAYGAPAVVLELTAVMRESIERNVAAANAMTQCRNIQDLMKVQSEWVRESYLGASEGMRRIAEASISSASQFTATTRSAYL